MDNQVAGGALPQNWAIIDGPFSSKEAATIKEIELASRFEIEIRGEEFEPDTKSGKWWVYSFSAV